MKSVTLQCITELEDKIYELAKSYLDQYGSINDIFLIGGQALHLWGHYYLIDELTAQDIAYITSDDLDWFGKSTAVRKCAAAWGGTFVLPPFDSHTPQTGKVLIPVHGSDETFIVDFLGSVYGLEDEEVRNGCDLYPVSRDGDTVEIPILSPPLCLKSRCENLLGLGYGEKHRVREIARIQVAIRIVFLYIVDALDDEDVAGAKKIVKSIVKYAQSNHGRRLYREYGIDLLEAIPHKHGDWPDKWKSEYWPRTVAYLAKVRG